MVGSINRAVLVLLSFLIFGTDSPLGVSADDNVIFPNTAGEKEILTSIQSLRREMLENQDIMLNKLQQCSEVEITIKNTVEENILKVVSRLFTVEYELNSLKAKLEEVLNTQYGVDPRDSPKENNALSSVSLDVKTLLYDLSQLKKDVVDIRNEAQAGKDNILAAVIDAKTAVNDNLIHVLESKKDPAVSATLDKFCDDFGELKKDIVNAVVDTSNVTESRLISSMESILQTTLDEILSEKDCPLLKEDTKEDTKEYIKEDTKEEQTVKISITENPKKDIEVVEVTASSCAEIFHKGQRESGIYLLNVASMQFEVYCDMVTDGGGWTVIQRRQPGYPQVDFYRNWTEYKRGFGDLDGEFWLGLDKINILTSVQQVSLRVDLEDFSGEKRYANYYHFHVDNEQNKYRLTVQKYTGNAGNSLNYHNGMAFTTWDHDNDLYLKSCAEDFSGAWWYKNCQRVNLNAKYMRGQNSYDGINWQAWRGSQSLQKTDMKIRPPL